METQTGSTDQKLELLSLRTTYLDNAVLISNRILLEVLKYRRFSHPHEACAHTPCRNCLAPHLAKIVRAVLSQQPVKFVLPAFPGKSPNLAKVFGPLPDMAEQCALEFLGTLCKQIQEIYSPGAEIILCSDGRVFSDAVGMRDEDVTAYQTEIAVMLKTLSFNSVSIFNLDELYSETDFSVMREKLLLEYGDSNESIQEKVRIGKDEHAGFEFRDLHRLYCGITRFLVEDSMFPGQIKSRSSIQKECRLRAYEVIRKSGAWSELIDEQFPEAVRLSIHPQGCGSSKLGLKLTGSEGWMTPWHGVAIKKRGQFSLLKRYQAEALGALIIYKNGRASHFELPENGS